MNIFKACFFEGIYDSFKFKITFNNDIFCFYIIVVVVNVVIVSDYSLNGRPYVLIDIRELQNRLQKTMIKGKKNKKLVGKKAKQFIYLKRCGIIIS